MYEIHRRGPQDLTVIQGHEWCTIYIGMIRKTWVILLIGFIHEVFLCSSHFYYDSYSTYNESERVVSVRGSTVRVALYHGSAPARAGAALLRALLTHALHYKGMRLASGPRRLNRLARILSHADANSNELAVAVSAAWSSCDPDSEEGDECAECNLYEEEECGVGGPRLRDFGPSAIPARVRLHLRLAGEATKHPLCALAARWPFYANPESLANCNFLVDSGAQRANSTKAIVYFLDEEGEEDVARVATELKQRIEASSLLLDVTSMNRSSLLRELRSADRSFLFLDYDVWRGEPGVRPAPAPPCAAPTFACRHELDPTEALRAADVGILTTFAPHLFDAVYTFKPSLRALRGVLALEAKGTPVQEAACEWALRSKEEFESWIPEPAAYYQIVVVLCEDPDVPNYINLLKVIGRTITERFENQFILDISCFYQNCSDSNALRDVVFDNMIVSRQGIVVQKDKAKPILGVVASGAAEARAAAALLARRRVPLLLYGAAGAGQRAWASAGRVRHLALALARFAAEQHWTRLAVLSDPTPFAADWLRALNETDHFAFRDFAVPLAPTAGYAQRALAELRDANARIVFVNTGAEAAAAILSAAMNEGMMREDKFVWIVREWLPTNVTFVVHHISISYGCRSDKDEASAPVLRAEMDRLWPGGARPAAAASLADAILTLANGFQEAMLRSPQIQYDLQTDLAIKRFAEVLSDGVGPGVVQELRYEADSRARAGARICVQRHGAKREQLGECRVQGPRVACQLRPAYPGGAPDDGASRCVARAGDAFSPRCYDAAWITVLVLFALAPPAALLARCALRRRRRRV